MIDLHKRMLPASAGADLAAGDCRWGMFLFLLSLHFHSFSSFSPVPLFHLLYYLFYLSPPFSFSVPSISPFLWETTQNDPQGLMCRWTPTKSKGSKASPGEKRRLWSACAFAQADQSLLWAHMQSYRKCCLQGLFFCFSFSSTEDTIDMPEYQKEKIECADFCALDWKFHGVDVNPKMKTLLKEIS